jgi:hypothetical protein
MSFRSNSIVLVLTIALTIFLQTGCGSGNRAPLTPQESRQPATGASTQSTHPADIRSWGTWMIHCVDPSGTTPASVEAVPLRAGEAHFDVTNLLRPPLCTNCMHVELVTHEGTDWTIKASLTNPTIQTAYDVMGIFPGTNCPQMLNPDSYTDLYDIDDVAETHNPFKAFETGDPNRKWGPGETHDQTFTFRRDTGEKLTDIIYTVAVSWPDNQPGVAAVSDAAVSGPLFTDTSHPVDFTVNILDWQDDVEFVVINLEPVNGTSNAHMQNMGDGVYRLSSYAAWGLIAGTAADLVITAKSQGADYLTYNYCHVEIQDPPPPATNFKVVSGPVDLQGPGTPSGTLDLAVVGNPDGTSSTFVNSSDTDVYAWNESYTQSELMVSIIDPSGSNPDFPVAPVSRIAFPLPVDPLSPDTFSILQTNLDDGQFDVGTTPPILYRNTLQIMDLENLALINFKLIADKVGSDGIDMIARPVDVSSGVKSDKVGYALWVPDGGSYPTYYPFVALVRYDSPYKDQSQEYDTLIGGIPIGEGNGKLIVEDINGLAVWDGDGESNIIIAVSEGGTTAKVEIFSIDYSSNPAGVFTPVTTLNGLAGTPLDVAMLPVKDAGLENENWLCILTDSRTVETYTLSGTFIESFMNPDALPGMTKHIAVDIRNLRIHVMMEGPRATVIEYKGD